MTNGKTDSEGDAAFDGLLAASGVPVSDAERAELRKAYDTLCELAARVRVPARGRADRPMPSFAATPVAGRKP